MTSFVSLTEARAAAEQVYSGITSVPSGWQIDSTFGDGGERQGPSGGYVYALKPSGVDDGRRMLVFRGTEVTLTNMKDLFADVTDIGKTQFGELDEFVNPWLAQELVAGRQVELVGHSLGGALVQWAINDTNMRDENANNNLASVFEIARTLPDPITGIPNPAFQINPNQLHFTTFNAPGITYVLGGSTPATDRTSVVVGEHHVVVGVPPIVQGDPIHLLGGPHVGGFGTQVIGHRVDFSQFDTAFLKSGLFSHTIQIPEYWSAPVGVYTPPPLDLALAQSFASHYSQLANTDGTVQGNLEAALRLALYASAIGVALGVGLLGTQAEAAAQLAGLQFDRDVFANTLALPGVGINQALEMITRAADAAGQNVVGLQRLVGSALIEVGRRLSGAINGIDGFITNTLVPWITSTAQGIGNAFSELLQDVPGVLDLGRILGFGEYKTYEQAYDQALQDRAIDSALRSALEEAQSIVQRAGQTVVVQQGIGANPFETAGFDPATAPPPTVNLNEGQVQALTINLPFEAGTGGQRLKLTLSGPNAGGFVLRTDGMEITPDGNVFTLTVPEGQKQLVVGLEEKQDISTSGSLTVTAQLVDASGEATHNSDDEATIALADTGDLVDGTGPTINYDNGQAIIRYDGDATDNTPVFNAGANHDAHGYGGNDVLNFDGSRAVFTILRKAA